jgi:hypothetical protein
MLHMFDRELEIRSSLFYDSCGKNYNNGNVKNGERARAGIERPLLAGRTADKLIIGLVAVVDKFAEQFADLA